MYNISSEYTIDTDDKWNKKHEMIKNILVDLIEENNLQYNADAIFYTLDEFMKETKLKQHLFENDTEINHHILFNIHKYISSIHSENSTNNSSPNVSNVEDNQEKSPIHTSIESLQQQRIESIQQHFENTLQERENEMKPNIPPIIEFKDENIDKYNANTIKLLETELESRKESFSQYVSQNEEYIWLDEIQIKNNIIKLKLPNNIQSCIINRVFFMNHNNPNYLFPDYIQLKTSSGQMSWFFKYNDTNVLHYTGEMNIYTKESELSICLTESSNIDDIKVFIQVKL